MNGWTNAQRKAIEARGPRTLVSAGAGSGKTRVLIERICRLVQIDQVPSRHILALTFTDKAAAQMKQRLEQQLGAAEAMICTFHRFCGQVIREHPVHAAVDPSFVLLDEAAGRAALRQIIEQALYEESSPEVMQWAEAHGLDATLQLLLSIYESWRERAIDMDVLRDMSEKAASTIRTSEWTDFQAVVQQMERLYHSQEITAPGTVKRMEAIVRCSRLAPERLEVLFEEVSKNVAKEAKPLFEQLAYWKHNQLWRDFAQDGTARIRAGFLSLLEKADLLFSLFKYENGWADFADLQRKAYRVLKDNPEIRAWYGQAFRHILVDEYQDTSPIQQAILELLEQGGAGHASIFMVGDSKQSIYRFRGAAVSGFERMRRETEAKGVYVELRNNFRAHPSLAAFTAEWTRRLFGEAGHSGGMQGMWEGADESGESAESTEAIELTESTEPMVELLVPFATEHQNPRDAEAELIARRICELPPALWGSTAILLQARTHLPSYRKALEKYGVPYEVHAGTGYWQRQEILDLFHLLRVLDDAGDSIALLGFLRGPLAGLSDEALWRLSRQGSLAHGFIMEHTAELSDEDASRLNAARRLLDRLKDRYRDMGLSDWMYALLYEEGVAAKIDPADFAPVLDMAEECERRGEFQLSELLLRWRERMEETASTAETATEDARRAVRIMTIHAAKGLEFSIVVVPDLTHRFSSRMGPLHISDTWGLAAKYYNEQQREFLPSLVYERARIEERSAMIAEQKRLLYVAMTRAKEKLIFSGAASAFSDKETLEECSNWFDWLPFLQPDLREGIRDGFMVSGKGWTMEVRQSVSVELTKSAKGVTTEPLSLNNLQTESLEKLSAETRLGAEAGLRRTESPYSRSNEQVPVAVMWTVTECEALLNRDKQPVRTLKRVRSVDTVYLEEHEWGRVLHHVLEHIRPADDLHHIRHVRIKAAMASVGVTVEGGTDSAWERLGSAIKSYMEHELHRECCRAAVVHSELPFACRLFDKPKPGLYLSGVIDKVWLRPDGGATLVDFKTHRCKTQSQLLHLINAYTPQVQLYVYAVEQLLGWRIDRAGLYVTARNKFVEIPCGDYDIRQLLQQMKPLWLEGIGKDLENKKKTTIS